MRTDVRPTVSFLPRPAIAVVTTILVTLMAVELLLRDVRVREQLPPRMVYYNSAVSIRQDALDRVLLDHGAIDVLFIGSSIVRTNIQPLLFDRMLEEEFAQPVVSFNTGMLGLWPRGVQLYLERVWLPAVRPRVVVQGIRYPELRSATVTLRDDQFFSAVVEGGWGDESGPLKRFASWATTRLRILQYRGVLAVQFDRWIGGRPGAGEKEEHLLPIDERGYTPRTLPLPEVLARGLIDDSGAHEDCCSHVGCELGSDAIGHAHQTATRAGALYILVNVPEFAGRWPGAEGRQRYGEYLSTLTRLAGEAGFRFLDITGGDPACFADEDEFSDYYHMSTRGAERFTRELAEALAPIIREHFGAAAGAGQSGAPARTRLSCATD